jgi:hypothetical protein
MTAGRDDEAHGARGVGDGQLLYFKDVQRFDAVADALTAMLRARGFADIVRIGDAALLATPTLGEVEMEATHAQLIKPVISEMVSDGRNYERFDAQARGLYAAVEDEGFFVGAEINSLSHKMLYDVKV